MDFPIFFTAFFAGFYMKSHEFDLTKMMQGITVANCLRILRCIYGLDVCGVTRRRSQDVL